MSCVPLAGRFWILFRCFGYDMMKNQILFIRTIYETEEKFLNIKDWGIAIDQCILNP